MTIDEKKESQKWWNCNQKTTLPSNFRIFIISCKAKTYLRNWKVIEMFTCAILCWLHSCDWIEWHDLCRKNDRMDFRSTTLHPNLQYCQKLSTLPTTSFHSIEVFFGCFLLQIMRQVRTEFQTTRILQNVAETLLHYSKCTKLWNYLKHFFFDKTCQLCILAIFKEYSFCCCCLALYSMFLLSLLKCL